MKGMCKRSVNQVKRTNDVEQSLPRWHSARWEALNTAVASLTGLTTGGNVKEYHKQGHHSGFWAT